MKTRESCPKCQNTNVVFSGNWSGVMVSDIHAEHFWTGKCNSCGFVFSSTNDDDKPGPISDKRDHA